jgi:hypothetical protein
MIIMHYPVTHVNASFIEQIPFQLCRINQDQPVFFWANPGAK